MEKAFDISFETEQVGVNKSLVMGRALCWISVNDVLYLSEESRGDGPSFVVKRIEIFDRDVDIIGPAWACRLTLEGNQIELLETVKYLYIAKPSQASRDNQYY